MIKRIISGVLLAGFAIGMFFLREVSPYFIDGVILVLIGLCMYELIKLFKNDLTTASIVTLVVYALSIYPAYKFFDVQGMLLLAVLFFIVFNVVGLFDDSITMNSLLKFMFMAIYPAILVGLALPLNNSEHGLILLTTMLAISVLTDTMALVVGMIVKGKKLCPRVSPKKTISGGIGGLLGGVGGSIAIYFMLQEFVTFNFGIGNIWVFVILGLLGSIMTQLGDLVASNLKRKTNIKDFGNLIPGHGGVIDRLDGVMFNIFTFYLFMFFFL